MNYKAVAVPYVIALVLGIGVIGLVGYLFVSTGGKFFGQSLTTQCDTQKLIFCQGGGWKSECGDLSKIDCNQLLEISGGTGSESTQSGPTFRNVPNIKPPEPGSG